jgi:parallel beta-helix repeat protein
MQLASCNTNEVRGNTLRNCTGPAIYVSGSSSDNTLHLNTITGSLRGFYIAGAVSQNNISFNSISGSTDGGIVLQGAAHTIIQGNTISDGNYGLELLDASLYTSCYGNTFLNNNYGVWVRSSAGNTIYNNNFVGTILQQLYQPSDSSVNTWDNWYPGGGNYWSNYAGVDQYHGPNQDLIGLDGKIDIAYTLNANNQDRFPYMEFNGWLLNYPPYPVFNPNPLDGAINVSISSTLSWSCDGDPNLFDLVTYDVYFGNSVPLALIASNISETTYDLGTLNYDTQYYWGIIAWDNHDASTSGPLWTFTTELGVDPNQSFVTLTNENLPFLVTCPRGDGPSYKHVKVTCRNRLGASLSGIPADDFIFTINPSGGDTHWYGTLSCTFTPVDQQTNMNGEIRFNITGDTSIYGNMTIQVTVQGVPLNDVDTLPCKTVDYDVNGMVSLGDFVIFARDYSRPSWRSDFTGDGLVSLGDFVVFAQHYGHHV